MRLYRSRMFHAIVITAVATVGCFAEAWPVHAMTYTGALTRTERVVVRPVTSSGFPARGFRVSTERGGSVDCSYPEPSPAAVNPDINYCAPSSQQALACWMSASAHRVLCLRNARVQRLASIRSAGAMAQVRAPKAPVPMNLLLGAGNYCTLRDGGAGVALKGHPNLGAFYYCQHGVSVWGPSSGGFGQVINRTHRLWTVRVDTGDGSGRLVTRAVARAWFVGTHA